MSVGRYFNQVEIDAMALTILEYQETIDNMSCYMPEGCENKPWPIGVPPPFKPPTRYDVLRWDYFNETHFYFKNDDEVINPMKRTVHVLMTFPTIFISLQELITKISTK